LNSEQVMHSQESQHVQKESIISEALPSPEVDISVNPGSENPTGAVQEAKSENVDDRNPVTRDDQSKVVSEHEQPQKSLEPESLRGESNQGEESEGTSANGTVVAYFTSSVQTGCAPLSVAFSNHSLNTSRVNWSISNGDMLSGDNPLYVFNEPGVYTVTLTVEDNLGQSSIHQQIIEAFPSPAASFEIEEGLEGPDGVEQLDLINYSTGGNSYSWLLLGGAKKGNERWSSVEFQPILKTEELDQGSNQLQLVVTNEYGCSDTTVQDTPGFITSVIHAIQFPTAFSPSITGPGGGHYSPHEKRTDVFHPVFPEAPPEYRLRIYTRRGELVFETENIYIGWDGYVQQARALGGVYVWMAEGSWENGETFKLQGDVTLIWNDQR
jgi:hypothetical protein